MLRPSISHLIMTHATHHAELLNADEGWSFARDVHLDVVFATQEIEHKRGQRDNHCTDECRKERFDVEIDAEKLRQIRSNQQQHPINDHSKHTQCKNNHWAGDEGQNGTNEQVNDAVYHGNDADFVPVATKCYAGNERKCRKNRQARNQPLQDIAPQCLHAVFLVFHGFP